MQTYNTEMSSLYLNSVRTNNINGFQFSFPCQISGEVTISYYFEYCLYNDNATSQTLTVKAIPTLPNGTSQDIIATIASIPANSSIFLRMVFTPKADKQQMTVTLVEYSLDGRATYTNVAPTTAQFYTTQNNNPVNGNGSIDFKIYFGTGIYIKMNHYIFSMSKTTPSVGTIIWGQTSNSNFNLSDCYSDNDCALGSMCELGSRTCYSKIII